jgi:subtilisin-like proprotein convertase family protein
MTRLLFVLIACGAGLLLSAQNSAFQFTSETLKSVDGEDMRTATVSLDQLRKTVKKAPAEFSGKKSKVIVSLPLPNGSFAEFSIYDSPLIKNHPELGSYKLLGPWGGGRLAISPKGVSAIALGPGGYFTIDPDPSMAGRYRVATVDALLNTVLAEMPPLSCGQTPNPTDDHPYFNPLGADAGAALALKAANEPQSLLVYDLAMSCTGEFARSVGGTQADVLDAFNTAISTLNGLYEIEFGIRFLLLDLPELIFLDGSTDPYNEPGSPGALNPQIGTVFANSGVQPQAYDIGHLLTTGCGNVRGQAVVPAGSGSVCVNGLKQQGTTCVSRGNVVGVALGTMAHEIGHQFSASHTWDRCIVIENSGRSFSTPVEPGSGNTILSYGSGCPGDNVGGRGPYFHIASIEQMEFFSRVSNGAGCATTIETNNLTPEVTFEYTNDFTIPISTPFRLEGHAVDMNGDEITYNWEQLDRTPSPNRLGQPQGNAPIFQSVRPTPTGNVRYFPRLDRIVNNINSLREVLPTYSRVLNFRLNARDNNPEAGGIDSKALRFLVDENAGPFVVDNPNNGGNWFVGDSREVTWEVANTDQPPINCRFVNVLLSVDGGETFDIVLAENVPNTGSTFVTVPQDAETSNQAYIMVEAADNVFLNVNNNAFSILPATLPTFTLEPETRYLEACIPDVLSIDLISESILNFDATINIQVEDEDFPEGASALLSTSGLTPGEPAILTLDLSNTRFNGPLNVTVVAVAGGADTIRRTILLDVKDNDYSDFEILTPTEGETGIILAANFSWTDAVNAAFYDIQISTSPTFGEETIFEEAYGLNTAEYTPDAFFEPSIIYFWRVRPANVECGQGPWTDPRSFKTVNTQCVDYAPQDTPVSLPGTGPSFTRESSVFVDQQGTISDLNIPNIKMRYNFASKVTLTLTSPAGTSVVLYQENCFSTNTIDLGFDDDAPRNIVCPPDDQRVFIPVGTLADFNGEDTFGTWTLSVSASETGGSAGQLESWSVEFCADLNSTPPNIVNSSVTEVPPLGRNTIAKDKLRVESDAFSSGEVRYTLTALPASGVLTLYGSPLQVGDTFEQADINGNGLFYENTNELAVNDDFGFVVTTPDGGYLPVTYHDILITDDAVVSNEEFSPLATSLRVFPNPVNERLSIQWKTEEVRTLSVMLFDVNGRLLREQRIPSLTGTATLDTSPLPRGIYLLRVDGAVRRIVKQ